MTLIYYMNPTIYIISMRNFAHKKRKKIQRLRTKTKQQRKNCRRLTKNQLNVFTIYGCSLHVNCVRRENREENI